MCSAGSVQAKGTGRETEATAGSSQVRSDATEIRHQQGFQTRPQRKPAAHISSYTR